MDYKNCIYKNIKNKNTYQISSKPLVTALICNYNYGRFLAQAIDSALDQTWQPLEVLVVDDGSTDDSRSILESYSSRVRVILKENGGQASAFNVGIAEAHGEIICFLDSDDFWYPNKVELTVRKYQEGSWGLVCNTLHEVNENGNNIDNQTHTWLIHFPAHRNSDLLDYIIDNNFIWVFSPTSGMSLPKLIADKIFPLPEKEWQICADNPLSYAAMCHAPVGIINKPLGVYRYHGFNVFASIRHDQIASRLYNFVSRTNRYLFLYDYLYRIGYPTNLNKGPKDFYKYYRDCCFITRNNPWRSLIHLWKRNLQHHLNNNKFIRLPKIAVVRYLLLDTLLAILILFHLPTPYQTLRARYHKDVSRLSSHTRSYLEND